MLKCLTKNPKHYYWRQSPIIKLGIKLSFRFPTPSPKWELNVTEQNVMQWDRILKYVTLTRCLPNNHHTAKPSQTNEVPHISRLKWHSRLLFCVFMFASFCSNEHSLDASGETKNKLLNTIASLKDNRFYSLEVEPKILDKLREYSVTKILQDTPKCIISKF